MFGLWFGGNPSPNLLATELMELDQSAELREKGEKVSAKGQRQGRQEHGKRDVGRQNRTARERKDEKVREERAGER